MSGSRSQIFADFIHGIGGVIEGGALGQMQGFKFLADVRPVIRELIHNLAELLGDRPAHGTYGYEG
jgi:hypothetical protein